MTVAVIGANGQLGSDVVAALTRNGDHVIALTHSDIELSDYASVLACLASSQPEFVVNTAAMRTA